MEYEHAFWIAACVAIVVYVAFGKTILRERKINEVHKRTIERMCARTDKLGKEYRTVLEENTRLQAQIVKLRPPTRGLLSELPELFTDEEFATRAQKAEADRAKGRRHSDRDTGPKPGLDWQEHDDNTIGTGI